MTGPSNPFTWLRNRYHASSDNMRGVIVAGVFVVVAAVVGGIFVVLAAIIQSNGSANSGGNPPADASEKANPPADITDLFQVQPCHTLPPDSPLAIGLRARREAIIDARCDSKPDQPVRAFPATKQGPAVVTSLDTGYILKNICLQSGEAIRDLAESKSSIWVRFQLDSTRQPFVPAIWVQGEDGAPPC